MFIVEMGVLIDVGFGYEEETGFLVVLTGLYLCTMVC
jgi:hypothetical protein